MADSTDVDFSKPMTVLKIGARLKKPYHKKPFMYVDKSALSNHSDFQSFLSEETRTWDNGTYVLKAAKQGDNHQAPTSFFAEFEKKEQEVRELPKASAASGRPYLCWTFFD